MNAFGLGYPPDGDLAMGQLGLGIIDADAAFGRRMASFFAEHGLAAEWHDEAKPLLARLPARPPRMVVLGNPRETGGALGALRRIREVSLVPCILITEGADAVSEIVVLEAGADGLLDRDTPMRAMLARIRSVLRRAEWGPVAVEHAIAVDGWRLMPDRRQLLRPDGGECPLTTAEFDLMALLVASRGRPIARDVIAEAVFRRPFRAEDRTVDNLVLRLRRKLGPSQQDSIRTVRGAGYLFGGFAGCGLRVA
jgi:DNA-binding response OmpR family regulator